MNKHFKTSNATSTFESLESRELMSAVAPGGNGNYDVVQAWNRVLTQELQAHMNDQDTTLAARDAAMVQVAMHDAMNGVLRRYAPIEIDKSAKSGTDPEAAGAAAAFQVLCKLFPKDKATLVKKLNASLGNVDDKKAAKRGVKFGSDIGKKVLKNHRHDGYAKHAVGYVAGTNEGEWRPTDAQDATASGQGPYRLSNLFTPVMPVDLTPEPIIGSADYATAFAEVKSLGSATGSSRTDDQTQIARFWSYDRGSFGTLTTRLNQALRTIVTATGTSPIENAELFAKANLAMVQAAGGVDELSQNNFWRPVTGIQQGNTDSNPLTDGDPNWQPLGAAGLVETGSFTPSGPSERCYQSAMGGAMFEVLRNAYGKDKQSFELKSDELPGVTRHYTSFSQAERECAESRVYLGVNWRFDVSNGTVIGHSAADFVAAHL